MLLLNCLFEFLVFFSFFKFSSQFYYFPFGRAAATATTTAGSVAAAIHSVATCSSSATAEGATIATTVASLTRMWPVLGGATATWRALMPSLTVAIPAPCLGTII